MSTQDAATDIEFEQENRSKFLKISKARNYFEIACPPDKGGGGSKKCQNWRTSFMNGPLAVEKRPCAEVF